MENETISVGSYGVNCTIIADAGRAFIVDPGQEGARILADVAQQGLVPAAVLLTHAHFDHITAVADLQKVHPDLPVYVHPGDRPMFGHPFNQLPPEYPSIGTPANLRDVAELAEVLPGVTVIHTPGHTPGGVCYHFAEKNLLLSGDTLFAGSVGRTDFPGGSMTRLMASLRDLMTLPDDTRVIPGHGPETTIGEEKRQNPYLI